MARIPHTSTEKSHRQLIVDFLARNPSVYDGHAYYNDFEDGTATAHVNANHGAACSLKPADESTITLAEISNSWSDDRDDRFLTVATGYECSCGELKDVILVARGEIQQVLLDALGVEPHCLLG